MNLIALESSSHRLSVALWRDGALSERAADVANGGSERLLPWLVELLSDAKLSLSDLDGVAFGAGPGGFTGLRLSCGLAQGLALGLDLPVLAVATLEALALASGADKAFACIDARMNEVYCAAYLVHGEALETVIAPFCALPSVVAAPAGTGWLGCGDGFASHPELLGDASGAALTGIRADLWPTAAAVARLAAPRLARGEGVDAGLAMPLYVRDKVALTTAERLARGGLK
ncbi:tRNA threonylcarbamoyladenosine biosynthesis protein TsaB [mine drainage metagenome]|uniref:tRNA threonylcarbamoyladenosine biosynthesis protein TsaB n=1 Tax=mine drainage metagenome TaxID=410659 RepID=A0A1J5S5Z7_9ZZZZ